MLLTSKAQQINDQCMYKCWVSDTQIGVYITHELAVCMLTVMICYLVVMSVAAVALCLSPDGFLSSLFLSFLNVSVLD